MQNHVISLRNANARREHIVKEFSKQNITFNFFNALTPDLALSLAIREDLSINESLITQGEIACLMSHYSLWKKMVEEDISYMAIFEDDIFLGEQAEEFLSTSAWINQHINIIKLEYFNPKVFVGKKKYSSLNRNLVELNGKNLGTAGYILSLSGAKKYLSYVQNMNFLIPLDHIMFDQYILENHEPVFQLMPALCIQEMILLKDKGNLSSALINERNERMYKQKEKGINKFLREYSRILNQTKELFFAKKNSFK